MYFVFILRAGMGSREILQQLCFLSNEIFWPWLKAGIAAVFNTRRVRKIKNVVLILNRAES